MIDSYFSDQGINMVADTQTASILLPEAYRVRDNSRYIRHYKIALKQAVNNRLSPLQRKYLVEHYWRGVSKSNIARQHGTSCSAVCKSLSSAYCSIREYIDLYMNIYKNLEKEWREDELI